MTLNLYNPTFLKLLLAFAFASALQFNSYSSHAQALVDASSAQSESVHETVTLDDGRVVYKRVDDMPVYKKDIVKFLTKTIRYPDKARAKGIQGRSVVQFIVNPDGHLSDFTVYKSSGSDALDEEAVRVLKLMENWRPGIEKGNPVAVLFTMPISFRLD